MPRALFLSPHLDDVAFSCAATLRRFVDEAFDVELVTVFTASVADPTGFALRCQTDKGLPPDLDYMDLRRAEDREFCHIAGVSHFTHWNFAEAPHRGYDAAPELFAGEKAGDEVWKLLASELEKLPAPDVVFAPQGLGNHVDHLQVIRAVLQRGWAPITRWYRDTPYAIREPKAQPSPLLPPDVFVDAISFDETELQRKVRGCCAYPSQIGFQFGGAEEVARKLRLFHEDEAQNADVDGFAERFLRKV